MAIWPGVKRIFMIAAAAVAGQQAWAGAPVVETQSGDPFLAWIAAGSYDAPGDFSIEGTNLSFSNNGSFVIDSLASPALLVETSGAAGADNNSGNGGNGGAPGYLTATNNGSFTINGLTGGPGPLVIVSFATSGGNGGNAGDSKDDGGAGGNVSEPLSVTNFGAIALDETSAFAGGGGLLGASSAGGNGGNVASNGNNQGIPTYDGGKSGAAGQAGNATLINLSSLSTSGNVTVGAGFAGAFARSAGGAPGNGQDPGTGGAGGIVALEQTGNVSISLAFDGNATTSGGLYALLAESRGSDGMFSSQNNVDGSDAGYGATAILTLNPGSSVSLSVSSANNPAWSAVVAALSIGGVGGNAFTSSAGGLGGSAGIGQLGAINTELIASGADVTASGDGVAGLLALNLAGRGGNHGHLQDDSSGGAGGGAYPVVMTVAGWIGPNATNNATVTTSGQWAPAVMAAAIGGAGGNGIYNDFDISGSGGDGGAGGSAADVALTINGTASGGNHTSVTVATSGGNSTGVLALSQGGQGGYGGAFQWDIGSGGAGGAGGFAGDVVLLLEGIVSVTTQGADSPAVVARSEAAKGGDADVPLSGSLGNGGQDGGDGGNSGDVVVVVSAASTLLSSGSDSPGIVAQSLSGGGGRGGSVDNGLVGGAGAGGAGGNTGNVTVLNSGGISTGGAFSQGILAQALSGAGGAGGNGTGSFYAGGGGSSTSGVVGQVTVTNNSSITTSSGNNSVGIHAQSVAGGGGAAGSASGGFVTIGGSASTNPVPADGNAATVAQSGNLTTGGVGAYGLLVQSIGGGGGSGGGADGFLVNLGGTGGGGGAGGASTLNATATRVETGGAYAHGALVQSIGGGGGSVGSSEGVSLQVEVVIGGAGGAGGAGGNATVNVLDSEITTAGTKAMGLVAHSVGGGGGAGGAAYGGGVGIGFSVGVALGGAGGDGGAGGTASIIAGNSTILTGQSPSLTAPTAQPTNLLPVDAFGLVARSVGGGGGDGGSSAAEVMSAILPAALSGIGVDANFAFASAGTGGDGGNGGAASLTLHNNSAIQTLGQGGFGMVSQSVGGGGGQAGDSSALSATLNYGRGASVGSLTSFSLNVQVALGASGGNGGDGGLSEVFVGGTDAGADAADVFSTVETYGEYANAIVAQSVGGGGGNAGFGTTTTQNFGSANNLQVGVGLGAQGGVGGDGGAVAATVFSTANVTTYGSGAVGVMAQSVGGGGGASQGGSFNIGLQATFPVFESPTSWSVGNYTLLSVVPAIGFSMGLGVNGSVGGNGGNASVTHGGRILTVGGDSTGILVQSVGGGGGLGGSTGSDGSADNPAVPYLMGLRQYATELATFSPQITPSFGLSVGSNGGGGGNGSITNLVLGGNSSVTTLGDWAHGAVAQSVGGGGGKAGSSAGTKSGYLPQITISLSKGGNGTGGDGGTVAATMNGTSISTGNQGVGPLGIYPEGGYSAFGLVLQSIAGGGGIAADGSDFAMNGVTTHSNGTLSVTGGIFVGGNATGQAGGSGYGGNVTVAGNGALNTVATVGDAAHGVILQSIGGGGGIGAAGSSAYVPGEVPATINMTWTSNSTTYNATVGTEMTVAVGGGEASAGTGGTVTLGSNAPIAVSTTGASAFGFLAQSIGGGGGLGAAQLGASSNASLGGNMSYFASETFEAIAPLFEGGTVQLAFGANSSITTSGHGSIGLVAQSIGGGGGIANYATGNASLSTAGIPTRYDSVASGGNVSVSLAPGTFVATTGEGAHGVLIQSVGNGGGLLATGGGLFAGSTGDNGSMFGYGGAIAYEQSGAVSATGNNAIGVFLQSTAAVAHNQTLATGAAIVASIGGNVTGGSGSGAGIHVDGGNANNTLTVAANATVSAASGAAIQFSTNSPTHNGSPLALLEIVNHGTVLGSVSTGGGEVLNFGLMAGSADLDGATFWNNFEFRPEGTIDADIVNDALLVANGLVTVTGFLDNAVHAEIVFRISGISDFGSFAVGAGSTFYGGFTVDLAPGYGPEAGDQFTLVSGVSNTFDLGAFSVLNAFAGLEWSHYALGNDYIFEITAIPEPRAWTLLALAFAGIWLLRKRRATG